MLYATGSLTAYQPVSPVCGKGYRSLAFLTGSHYRFRRLPQRHQEDVTICKGSAGRLYGGSQDELDESCKAPSAELATGEDLLGLFLGAG